MNLKLCNLLRSGNIAIIPTDTIYGIVGSALNPDTVEQIYSLRKRSSDKPMIILISKVSDFKLFDIDLNEATKSILEQIWPNQVSFILACPESKFEYLHRGTNSLAFRIPNNKKLLKLLSQTGPLVAPSANFEGELPAKTIKEAKRYFGNEVNFYEDEGTLEAKPSTLIKIVKGKIQIIRQGAWEIPNFLVK